MDPLADLPPGWQVWNVEPDGRVVLVYRPDVFDGEAFPAACLPTLTVAPGATPDGRPAGHEPPTRWHVALYLEPVVRVRSVETSHEDREAAVEQAVAVAREFTAGKVAYRDAYRSGRDTYLDRLDDLIGTEE